VFRKLCRSQQNVPAPVRPPRVVIEALEGRRLLSASSQDAFGRSDHGGHGRQVASIEFSQAPTAVQSGLDALAATDGVAAPASTQTVFLSNVKGVERYTVDIIGTGTNTALTVNQAGNPVTAPTPSTTTFGALGTSDATAASEISAIATVLSLTAPTSTTTIHVSTSGGVSTYSVALVSTTTTNRHHRSVEITVDASGNPLGNIDLPFSVIPAAIQAALNNHAPAGATALAASSTQTVQVRTTSGVTTYSAPYTASGTTTTVTVDTTGTLATLPTTTDITFSAIPSAAQTELQTLATADGYSGAIAAGQTISAYNEANGTTIYTVTLPATKTGDSGQTFTINITLSVDQLGNPTTLPTDDGFGGAGRDGTATTAATGSTSTSGSNSNDVRVGGFTYGFARHRR
jgi:hypothetical protein